MDPFKLVNYQRSWEAEALHIRALGLSVIPIHGPKMPPPSPNPEKDIGKIPLIGWREYQNRLAREDEIQEWGTRWPDANWGVVTGAVSELIVLDVDGEEGRESLRNLGPVPATWRSATGKGEHLWFRHPGEEVRNFANRLPGLDLRGDGGYVVAPPSLHASGQCYEWIIAPSETELADSPGWLLDLISRPPRTNTTAPVGEYIPQGARNTTLASLAGTMRRRGMSEKAILVALLAENAESCDPPLTDEEVERIASSVARYDPSGPGPILVTLADVNPMPISWLWPGRIPFGKLSLIAGDPGVGKSLLVSDMAARISIGGPWPDGGNAPKGKVILLTAEDGLADTVRPRLDAMGGDPSSVVVLTGVLRNGADEMFDLTEDLPHLETAIVQTGAHFVAIDPLSAYLGKTDSYKDPDVRKVLTPLGALAEQRNVAIVGIMHLSKDAQRKALYRTQGSVAFVAAGRATYVVTADHYESERKLLLPLKVNIAASPPGLAFAISDDTGDTARVVWETNPVEVDAEAALAGPSPTKARTARNDAMMLLREVLADGPVPAMELEYQAEQSGIKKRTLDRAKKALGVQSRKKEGKDGEWEWVLPDNVATEGTPGEVATLATFDQDRSTNTEMANALDKDAKNANSQGEANIGGWAYPVRRTPSGVRLRIAKKPRWWEMARRGGVRRHRDRKKGTR